MDLVTLVEIVRLSIGTAIQIGLESGEKDPNFTAAFLMTYREEGCDANCAFCPQARDSTPASDRLSRISWPEYNLKKVIENWPTSGHFRRICIQTVCYPELVQDVLEIVRKVREISRLPISVAIHPISFEDMQSLREAGVSTIGIALDAGTAKIFEEIKGIHRGTNYRWEDHRQGLSQALSVFGIGNVTTHLIIGLGESEKEAADFIFDMYEMGISVGLFAFTSIKGTSLEDRSPPDLSSYRRIQVVRELVSKGLLQRNQVHQNAEGRISFGIDREIILKALASGTAFQVTGCKGCNRPYYTERPRGPMYNYPRPLTKEEVARAIEETSLVV